MQCFSSIGRSLPEKLTFTFWSWWRHQATPTFDDVTKLRLMIDLANIYRPAKFQFNRICVTEILAFTFWNWWRHQATRTFDDVPNLRLMIDVAILYRLAKFQYNRTFDSVDIDIHILKLMTWPGHAHFWWRHKTSSDDRPCHYVSGCKVSIQSDTWFLRYWHSHFEVDDVIRTQELLMTSQNFA